MMAFGKASGVEGDGKYHRIALVGQGGMADVWLVTPTHDARASRLFALKELRAGLCQDPDFVSMFVHEAKLAMRLDHPHVVRTHGVNLDHERPYLLMEWLEGQPLQALFGRLGRKGGVPLPVQVYVLAKTLAALDYVHEFRGEGGERLDIVHRDVSPHNVFVGYDGAVKLMDFGIAKVAGGSETQGGVVKGKVGYMAPEQLLGKPLDRRADVFSVGVMLWEALVGQRLTAGDDGAAVFSKRVQCLHEPVAQAAPDAPPELAAAADRAMRLDPAGRYPTAAAMRADLEAWLATCPVGPAEVARVVANAFAEQRQRVRELIDQQTGALRAGLRPSAVLHLNGGAAGDYASASGITGSRSATGRSTPGLQLSIGAGTGASVPQPPPGLGEKLGAGLPRFTPAEKTIIGVFATAAAAAVLVLALREPGPAAPPPSLAAQAPVAPLAAPTPTQAPFRALRGGARALEASAGDEVAREVDLVVWAQPEGARVFIDDEPVGATPLSLRLLQDAGSHTLRVSALGFRDEERVVSFARDLSIEFSLKAQPRAVPNNVVHERPRRGQRPHRTIDESDPYH
ncbi:MAG TPA: serine/threonine-protein kinase [Polyangiaceae bacterium]|nr:serine/threonine-protein kinase [Polyangiaceae bacterium]